MVPNFRWALWAMKLTVRAEPVHYKWTLLTLPYHRLFFVKIKLFYQYGLLIRICGRERCDETGLKKGGEVFSEPWNRRKNFATFPECPLSIMCWNNGTLTSKNLWNFNLFYSFTWHMNPQILMRSLNMMCFLRKTDIREKEPGGLKMHSPWP
jgi:hypothetical protein